MYRLGTLLQDANAAIPAHGRLRRLLRRLRILWQEANAVFPQLTGRPHTKTRRQFKAAVDRITGDVLSEQRLTIIPKAAKCSPEDICALMRNVTFEPVERRGMPVMTGTEDRLTLHLLMKVFQPKICVETGVSGGSTSAVILADLTERNTGKLHSIDIESRVAHRYGELIPEGLRGRWQLHIQKRGEVLLPKLLESLGEIDFFLHDSVHTVRHMMWEYQAAWSYLRSGGILASHDVLASTAFHDFYSAYRHEIAGGGAIGNLGFWLKV